MDVSELSGRCIRIESKPDELRGWMVKVTDATTGEEITHVARAVITLDARELNVVELTYYEHDANGKILADAEGKPMMKTVTKGSPEVSVTALERLNDATGEEKQ